MRCRAIPYEGNEPYLFFSYCRLNADSVYPIIERMASEGFRIWYDNGIHPGDDWPEVIADHINRCAACVAAVSEEFAGSHNCKNEMNYVVGREMVFVPIIMTDFVMTPGMKFMLAGSQYIRKFDFQDIESFYQRLLSADCLQNCRGLKNLLSSDDGECNAPNAPIEQKIQKNEKCERPEKQEEILHQQCLCEEYKHQEQEKYEVYEPDGFDAQAIEDIGDIEDDDMTILEEVEEHTIRIESGSENIPRQLAILIHIATGEVFELSKAMTKIGRGGSCDFILTDRAVGSLHAIIGYNSSSYFLRDEDSLNGTWLNNQKIDGMRPVPLNKTSIIKLAREELLFAVGEFADEVLSKQKYSMLYCSETSESRILETSELIIGRSNAWAGGTLTDTRASREHGKIQYTNGEFIFMVSDKRTTNGTFLNGTPLEPGVHVALKDNDEIRIGHVYHIQFQNRQIVRGG